MRYPVARISIFAVFAAISDRADDVIPPRFNFDRYSAMVDHSPFAIATAVALPAAALDFAKDLYVANAARSPEGDMVTIASSSDQNFKKYLTTREPVDGYSISSIEWSDRVGATKVTISKDGKFANLTFNQALLSEQAPPNAPPAPGQPAAAIRSPFMPPSVPGQAPRVRARSGMIQRNPTASGVPTPPPLPTPNLEPSEEINPQQQQNEPSELQQRRRKSDSYRP